MFTNRTDTKRSAISSTNESHSDEQKNPDHIIAFTPNSKAGQMNLYILYRLEIRKKGSW
jgi:hypothetical protein